MKSYKEWKQDTDVAINLTVAFTYAPYIPLIKTSIVLPSTLKTGTHSANTSITCKLEEENNRLMKIIKEWDTAVNGKLSKK